MQIQLKVANGSKSGQVITINRPKFLIGRADDCQLKPKSELISRYHCAILSEDGYVAVRDLGSRNGVFVNGNRITIEEELHNGDRLAIGPLEFDIVLTVALSTGKKPKVESIADVVARTVERDSISTGGTSDSINKGGVDKEDAMEWLLSDEEPSENDSAGQKTIQVKVATDKMKLSEEEPAVSAVLTAPKPKKRPDATPTKTAPVKKPAAVSSPAAPAPDPDQTANLLKNFFQNH